MLAKVVLDPQDVGADAFAAVREAIAVTLQTSFAEHHLVVSICAMHHDLQGILAGALEAFRLSLVAMGFGNQAV
ncbi:MAG: hypothetical protein E6I52_03010 [Chloroflexi bacterium]|nr:MAG: hypothetical protein E6I52_03010 [Chloroflexota bacterium]